MQYHYGRDNYMGLWYIQCSSGIRHYLYKDQGHEAARDLCKHANKKP